VLDLVRCGCNWAPRATMTPTIGTNTLDIDVLRWTLRALRAGPRTVLGILVMLCKQGTTGCGPDLITHGLLGRQPS